MGHICMYCATASIYQCHIDPFTNITWSVDQELTRTLRLKGTVLRRDQNLGTNQINEIE